MDIYIPVWMAVCILVALWAFLSVLFGIQFGFLACLAILGVGLATGVISVERK